MAAFIYIMASQRNGTLYIGVTANIAQRINQHKRGEVDGFTKKYNVNQLVYAEAHNSIEEAIQREKSIKEWKRDWKLNLIEASNPEWVDLSGDFL